MTTATTVMGKVWQNKLT